jgi:hypothetical protein
VDSADLSGALATPRNSAQDRRAINCFAFVSLASPCCGGRMLIIETFAPGCEPKYRPTAAPRVIRIDTS